ncbi:MAG: alpha/beta hydrolase, partial [Myxococcota bacterium]
PQRDAVAAAETELGVELETSRVTLGEVELFVVAAGPADGPLVVLLHGYPEFWYAWRGPLAQLAAAGFRAVAPDQRGYDQSDKPGDVESYRIDRLSGDVAALIAVLGHESAFVVGHDWGGGVAWDVALRHPERVRKLAVIDTPHPNVDFGAGGDEDQIDWFRTFFQLSWLPERVARLGNWELVAGALRDTSIPGTFSEETLDLYRSAWDRDDSMAHMIDWYRAGFRYEAPDPPDWTLRLPVMVVVAPGDVFIPGDLTRASMPFLEDGRLVELEEGTHWVIQERPDEISRLLIEFFRG